MVARNPFDAGPQPADRAPAPGRLGLVQAYVNSFWDLEAGGADAWAGPSGYGAWLRARGFSGAVPSDDDRREAIEVREALRALARANHGEPEEPAAWAVLDAAAARAPVIVRFDPRPVHHAAAGHGHTAALGLTLAVVAEALADGTWPRMKACPGPACGWLFHDSSRNRSSQWCSMRVCGNRVKGQAFRARRRTAR